MFRKWSSVWEIYPFKAGKHNHQLFLAECHLLHMIMLLLLKKKAHLFVSPSRQTTLNSALQRALKHFNNACSTTKGSISTWSIDVTIKLRSTTKWNPKKNQFSKQTGYTSNISISLWRIEKHDLEFFLDPSHLPDLSYWQKHSHL